MSYAVLHMKKIKGNGVTGMQIHNQREKESDTNADIEKDKSHLNYDLVNDEPIDYHKKVNKMINERVDQSKRKVRKDAVRIASFMITSDKAFFDRIGPEEEKRFFKTAKDFIADRYGKDNIAYAMVHKDEKTPHMHLGLVPITEDNRLSAKDFFGERKQLFELQDDFHAHMTENGFDLERGISSDRKHLETAQFKLKTTQEKTKELEKNLEKIEQIDGFDEKVKEGLFSKRVTIDKSDFEAFKDVAKAGILLIDENRLLEDKLNDLKASNAYEIQKLSKELKTAENERDRLFYANESLFKQNEGLKQANRELQIEKNYLEAVLEGIKNYASEKIKDFSEMIGFYKGVAKDIFTSKLGLKVSHEIKDEEEQKGFSRYQSEREKENEKKKEMSRDEFELG